MPCSFHEWLKRRGPSFQPLRNNRTIPTCANFLCLPCNHTHLNRVIGLSLQFRYLKLIWRITWPVFALWHSVGIQLNCLCINFKDAKTAKKVLLSHKDKKWIFCKALFFFNYCFIFIFVTLLNKTFPGNCLRYFFFIRVIFYFQKKCLKCIFLFF